MKKKKKSAGNTNLTISIEAKNRLKIAAVMRGKLLKDVAEEAIEQFLDREKNLA